MSLISIMYMKPSALVYSAPPWTPSCHMTMSLFYCWLLN